MSGSNGRGPDGRFARGNFHGGGNPHARAVNKLRTTILKATNEDDVREIWAKLIEMAKEGNLKAAQYVLDRLIGKPKETVEVAGDAGEAMAALREGIKRLEGRGNPKVEL